MACFNRAHAQNNRPALIPAGGKLGVTSLRRKGGLFSENESIKSNHFCGSCQKPNLGIDTRHYANSAILITAEAQLQLPRPGFRTSYGRYKTAQKTDLRLNEGRNLEQTLLWRQFLRSQKLANALLRNSMGKGDLFFHQNAKPFSIYPSKFCNHCRRAFCKQ